MMAKVTGRRRRWISRRGFLYGTCAAVGAGAAGKLLWNHNESFLRSATVVARAGAYDGRLEAIIRHGLEELGFDRSAVTGRRVLLKPNLVEPDPASPHINTDPTLVRAAIQVFRRWDARQVLVAEGAGHQRDSALVLEHSAFRPMLQEEGVDFFDLNYDEVEAVDNETGYTGLKQLYLPRTLRRFDLIVSLPKMKTHHWAGVTLSMKNLFGVMPGIIYGWPKNVLHWEGISRAILDITAAVKPHLAIVDGIIGMEGDGPIMGQPRRAGLIVMGRNPVAVDATAARLMGFEPRGIDYLAVASGRLGPIAAGHIEQRGEAIDPLIQRFRLLDHPLMKPLAQSRL
jgi:uncharacterized protein (DUF362 family)